LGMTTPFGGIRSMAEKIVNDIEGLFNIEGMLQEVEVVNAAMLGPNAEIYAWGMNYTASRNYTYFLDFYENNQVIKGNISQIFSKENMLNADKSFLFVQIIPDPYFETNLGLMGVPTTVDYGESVTVVNGMTFDNYFDYSVLDSSHTFSLADLTNINQINMDAEYQLTFPYAQATIMITCGNFTNNEVDPNGIYTSMGMGMNGYTFNITDLHNIPDITFNFTAPLTQINTIAPLIGSMVHGDVDIIFNATMIDPPGMPQNADIQIFEGGVYGNPIPSIPLMTFSVPYNTIDHYWNFTWNTLNVSLPNGLYDIVFTVYDNQSRRQSNFTRVYVENTFYLEQFQIGGDITGNFCRIRFIAAVLPLFSSIRKCIHQIAKLTVRNL